MASKTAFIVTIDENYDIAITTDPKIINLEGMREANLKDIRRAVLEISADLAAQAASQYFLATITPSQPEETPEG